MTDIRIEDVERPPPEMKWLVVGLGASVLIFLFVVLAAEVTEGDTQAFDVRILHSLRSATDPSMPIRPTMASERHV